MTDWTAPLPPRTADTADETLDQPSGTLVGRYVMLHPVGSGGAGAVYAAFDPHLDRKVAIKFLHPQWDDTKVQRTRLLSEARALARLAHPNVVTVHDVGSEGDRTFVAMELVAGEDLGQWLERGGHATGEVLAVMTAAARGLLAAHEQGIVHGDFKPRNVLLARTEGGPIAAVKVGDFGLARLAPEDSRDPGEESADDVIGVTTGTPTQEEPSGSMTGTPAYMAPEQYWRQPIDARTDQYSFCLSLWEALVGERPFSGTLFAQAHAKAEGPPVAPRGSNVPPWLFDLMRRGMQPDPAQRWPSMEAVLTRLEAGDPRRARRRRVVIGMTAVGLVGAGVLAGTAGWTGSRCSGASAELAEVWESGRRRTVHDALATLPSSLAASTSQRVVEDIDAYAQNWADEHQAACEASVRHEQSDAALDARMRCLRQHLGGLDGLVEVLEAPDVDVLMRAVDAVSALPASSQCRSIDPKDAGLTPSDPRARADAERVRDAMARIRAVSSAGRDAEALETLEPLLQDPAFEFPPLRAERGLLEGRLRLSNSEPVRGLETLRETYDEALRSEHLDVATQAAVALAGAYISLFEDPDNALRWEEHARPLAEREGEPAKRRIQLLIIHATILRVQGKYEDTETTYQQVLQMLGTHPDSTLHQQALAGLAHTHMGMGRYDEALREYDEAMRLAQKSAGEDHPQVAKRANDLGVAYMRLDRHEEGIALLRDSVVRGERSLGPDHQDLATMRLNLAAGLGLRGHDSDDDEAAVLLEKTLAIYTRLYGADSIELFRPLINLSAIRNRAGQTEQALKLSLRALALQEGALGPDNPELCATLFGVGVAQLAADEYEAAQATLERMLALAESKIDRPNPFVADALLALGPVHAEQGRFEEAVTVYRRAVAEYEAMGKPNDPDMTTALGGQAVALRSLGRHAEAGPMFVRAVDNGFDVSRISVGERAVLRLGAAEWLWSHPGAYDNARPRAVELAKLALEDAREDAENDEGEIAAAEAWLRRHRL